MIRTSIHTLVATARSDISASISADVPLSATQEEAFGDLGRGCLIQGLHHVSFLRSVHFHGHYRSTLSIGGRPRNFSGVKKIITNLMSEAAGRVLVRALAPDAPFCATCRLWPGIAYTVGRVSAGSRRGVPLPAIPAPAVQTIEPVYGLALGRTRGLSHRTRIARAWPDRAPARLVEGVPRPGAFIGGWWGPGSAPWSGPNFATDQSPHSQITIRRKPEIRHCRSFNDLKLDRPATSAG